jgi:GNAT superfamily N-acetyltransferase
MVTLDDVCHPDGSVTLSLSKGAGAGARWLSKGGGVTGSEILALYDAEMRADPPRSAGVWYERDGSVVRSVGLWNVVLSWRLSESELDAAVAEQAARARSAGLTLEWKVYEHDGPAGIGAALERAGFVADPRETFMVFDLARDVPDDPGCEGLEIREVVDAAGVDDFIAVGDAAFGRDNRAKAESYRRSLGDLALALFVAYRDGKPVSAGRLQLPAGRSFASMWGGGTVPGQRGRGMYRALVSHRAREARRRGYRYLTVDAAETSRPILERLGFAPLTGITGYVLRQGA